MEELVLFEAEKKLMEIIWQVAPIESGKLVKIAADSINWTKSTTYTVLRKLCEKGLLQNVDGIVTSQISREEFYSAKSEQIVDDSYRGSLPAFVAAFVSKKGLTADEAEEIQRMIDAYRKEV